jgi:hypothetical protein
MFESRSNRVRFAKPDRFGAGERGPWWPERIPATIECTLKEGEFSVAA